MANVIDQVRVKAGRLIRIWNTLRKKNEKRGYVAVWVEDANGTNERCLLFTERELLKAEIRASKNAEDLTTKGFLTDLID